jgi:succinate-acetate transporter protein
MADSSVLADLASFAFEALRSFGWFWIAPAAFLAVGGLLRVASASRFGPGNTGLAGFGRRLVGCGTMLLAMPFAMVAFTIALVFVLKLLQFHES